MASMTTDFSWTTWAACKAYFASGETTADWYADAATHACREAVEICNSCPVQKRCLEHAMETDEAHGVWGGLTPAQRRMLARGHSREQALLVTRTYPRH